MIVKTKNQPPEFGHMVTLTMGVHFVLDCIVERGNPADVTLAVRQIERQVELRGSAPEQVAFDGGNASAANLEMIKALGTKRCALPGEGAPSPRRRAPGTPQMRLSRPKSRPPAHPGRGRETAGLGAAPQADLGRELARPRRSAFASCQAGLVSRSGQALRRHAAC